MEQLELSVAEARMIALQTLGLRHNLAAGKKGTDAVLSVLDHLSLLQMDTVNVFERAHYLPVFSRIGGFDRQDLTSLMSFDRAGADKGGPELIEYWAHEASVIPTTDLPLYRWRMDSVHTGKHKDGWTAFANENRGLLDWMKSEIADRGPLSVGDLEHERNVRRGPWWGWSDVKNGLEWMFMAGEVVSGGRKGFTRTYALPEQILPETVRVGLEAAGTPEAHLASRKTLLLKAAATLGIATAKDLVDYHRQSLTVCKSIITHLVEAGSLLRVKVQGWQDEAYLASTNLPLLSETPTGGTNPTTILSPFDPLVWNRERAVRLFDFDYKIEIYTPKPKRIYGYYTLPILHNRRLVGRIDLKSDRQNSCLMVQAAWAETWLTESQRKAASGSLARTLKVAQTWQGLDRIAIEPIGTLSPELTSALAGK